MKKAIIYARVSTTEQAVNGTSLEQQQERGFEYAERRDAIAVRVCVDAGVSGALYETRPGIIEAIEAIERKEAELLIVTKVDRLGRSARVIQQIAERIDRAGGQIVTCDGMELGRTSVGKLTLNTFAGMAEFERDTIRERSMNGRRAKALQGVQTTRNRSPYGYHIVTHKDVDRGLYSKELTGQYVIVEETAPWIREIFTRYAGGASLRAVASWLEAQGVPTPRNGKGWQAKSLHLLLANPVYKGEPISGRLESVHDEARKIEQNLKSDLTLRVRPESEWIRLQAPALVDAATWEECQRRRQTNRETISGNPNRKFMLSSLTRCPVCGYKMVGSNQKGFPRADGTRKDVQYYKCYWDRTGCPRKVWPALELEQSVIKTLAWLAENPAHFSAAVVAYDAQQSAVSGEGPSAERDRLTAEQKRLEKELTVAKESMKAALRAGLRPEDFESDFAEIAQRRAAVETRLAELSAPRLRLVTGQPKDVAEKAACVSGAIVRVLTAPDELYSPSEKQAFLAGIVESVTPGEDSAAVRLLTETVYMGTVLSVSRGQ